MCGSFAGVEEPPFTGECQDTRTGRGGEAIGRWHRRDSTLSAGATVSARRWSHGDVDASRPKVSETAFPFPTRPHWRQLVNTLRTAEEHLP